MADPNETTAGSGGPQTSGPWGVGSLVGDGRYRLTGKLGRGGMAEVFAAEDVRLGRTVAVKLLRGDLAEDPISKARFTREAQSVAGLNHHAVVAVYDSGEDMTSSGPLPYMVMELVEGRTIKELLAGPTPPPVDQALLIVSGVLDALAYSHQHGIVHRDIKPANVIITTTGAVKVMDFGIARALHGAASTMTQTGMVMGTPQYLSPEQALGKTVDHRSDLYATGCLLYELLALRPPFVGETPLSVVYQHVQDEPAPPSQLSDRVPPELDGLVLRALAKQPEDRYQSAEEFGGVVAYAHQELSRYGGWSGGMWNTGAVTAVSPHGPGAGAAPTAAQRPGQGYGHGSGAGDGTARLEPPLLAGIGGASDGYGYGSQAASYDAGGGSGGARRWVKAVVFVVAAVLAIVLGVFIATQSGGSGRTPARTTPPSATHDTGQPTETTTPEQPADTGEATTAPVSQPTFTQRTTAPVTTAPPAPTTTATTPEAPTTTPTTEPATTTPPATDEPTTAPATQPPVTASTTPAVGVGGAPGSNHR